jgi:hypothetical protein
MILSTALIIFKGIDYGDQIVQKWLTSLIISFFASLLLTQPLKVRVTLFDIIMRISYILSGCYKRIFFFNHSTKIKRM